MPGGCRNEGVVRKVLNVEGTHNLLSQSRLMDRAVPIAPVNGYGIKLYDKVPAESTGEGRGILVGVVCQIGG
jgi:hypothetical protein